LNILALERGEFVPGQMNEDAFKKYRKNRHKLSSALYQAEGKEPVSPDSPVGEQRCEK